MGLTADHHKPPADQSGAKAGLDYQVRAAAVEKRQPAKIENDQPRTGLCRVERFLELGSRGDIKLANGPDPGGTNTSV
ncbi:MAG: hypothetical protein ABIO51_06925 [Solirubrobacteraceae bacterium]